MTLISSTVFCNVEINQNWNYNKIDKITKYMFLIDYQYLQNYFVDYIENWNIYFLSEFSSEFSCLSNTKKNEKKQHDTLN